MVLRARRELGKPHRPQLAADRLAARRDPELLPKPLRQIDQPPAHHPIEIGPRPRLHGFGKRHALVIRQARRLPRRRAVDQTRRTLRIEPEHPVTHDLQSHPAGPCRRRSRRPVIDRSQCQKTPRLIRIPARLRQPPHLRRRVVRPKCNRCPHGKSPSVSHGESRSSAIGNPQRESGSMSVGMTLSKMSEEGQDLPSATAPIRVGHRVVNCHSGLMVAHQPDSVRLCARG